MRLLGMDVGDRRIGIATAQTEVKLAFPHSTLERSDDDERDLQKLAALCTDEMAQRVIVGMPLLMSGESGEQARKTQAFVEKLQTLLRVPVETVDERLTSWDAENRMRELNLSPQERKKKRDAIAAALILEAYLANLGDTDGF